MLKSVLVIALLAALARAQDRPSVQSDDGDSFKGVKVQFAYHVSSDNEFVKACESFPEECPAKIIWYWGDDEPNAKLKNYSTFDYVPGQKVSHFYSREGEYSIFVIVVDSKGRNVVQTGRQFRVNARVELDPSRPCVSPTR